MSRALILALVLPPLASAATAPDSPDHANHFQAEPITASGITVSASSAFARQQEAKLKLKLANATDHFVLVQKNGARIAMDSGEFVATNREGVKVIDPASDGGHTFVFADTGGQLHQSGMTLRIEGVSLVTTKVPPVEAAPFTLPLTTNKVEAGGFSCVPKGKVKQATDQTSAKFECTYLGAAGTVGLIRSDAITVAIPDGKDFANEAGEPIKLLLPGESETIEVKTTVIQPKPHGVDMQFTELTLLWNDALLSVELQPVTFPDWTFTLDVALTDEKNQ